MPSLPVAAVWTRRAAPRASRKSDRVPPSAMTDGARVALVDDEETLIAVAERVGDVLQPEAGAARWLTP